MGNDESDHVEVLVEDLFIEDYGPPLALPFFADEGDDEEDEQQLAPNTLREPMVWRSSKKTAAMLAAAVVVTAGVLAVAWLFAGQTRGGRLRRTFARLGFAS